MRWRTALRSTVRSLRNRNFRLFMAGHLISNTGMWLQNTAELWAILQITGSGVALGIHSVLRFGPLLVFGAYGGLIADRMDRRKLLIATQSAYAVAAVIVAVAAIWGEVTLPLIYATVFVQGMVNAVDNPLRRGFVRDLTTDAELGNALGLSTSVGTFSRTLGPALGGVIIATLGLEWCFAINAGSYAGVLASLFMLDRSTMRPSTPVARQAGQLREGFRYAWTDRRLRVALLMVAVVSTFAWNWNVILPVFSTDTLGGDASLFGILAALISLGSVVGALAMARTSAKGGGYLIGTAAVLALSLLAVMLAPGIGGAVPALVLLGASGAAFTVCAQTRLQLNTVDSMVGRIMALFSIAWLGSRPLGGVVIGGVMDLGGPRLAFGFAGCAIAATVAVVALRGTGAQPRSRRRPRGVVPGSGTTPST